MTSETKAKWDRLEMLRREMEKIANSLNKEDCGYYPALTYLKDDIYRLRLAQVAPSDWCQRLVKGN